MDVVTAEREAEVHVEASVASPKHTEESVDKCVNMNVVAWAAGAWLDSLTDEETAIVRDSDVVPPVSLDDVDDVLAEPHEDDHPDSTTVKITAVLGSSDVVCLSERSVCESQWIGVVLSG